MKTTLLTVFAAAAVLLIAGCDRKQASPEFEQASRAFSKLYGEKLDDAFLDPRMAEIEALLQRVPEDSLDANNAQQLLTRIREGRERMQAHLERTQEAVEAATEPLPYVESRAGPGLEERPPEAEPDAGTGPAHPVQGMPLAELMKRFGDCFASAGSVEITGRGPRETYELSATDACRTAHPGFDQKFIVIEDAKIFAVAPKSSIQTRTVPAGDAGTPPNDRPDAGR